MIRNAIRFLVMRGPLFQFVKIPQHNSPPLAHSTLEQAERKKEKLESSWRDPSLY